MKQILLRDDSPWKGRVSADVDIVYGPRTADGKNDGPYASLAGLADSAKEINRGRKEFEGITVERWADIWVAYFQAHQEVLPKLWSEEAPAFRALRGMPLHVDFSLLKYFALAVDDIKVATKDDFVRQLKRLKRIGGEDIWREGGDLSGYSSKSNTRRVTYALIRGMEEGTRAAFREALRNGPPPKWRP